jgi:hypothetical protein
MEVVVACDMTMALMLVSAADWATSHGPDLKLERVLA